MRIPAVRAVLLMGVWAYALLGISGCAIYSETRHKQAVAAKEAWSKVDLAGQLTAARKNEAALLAEQLRTEDTLRGAARNATANALVMIEGNINDTLLRNIQCELLSPGNVNCKDALRKAPKVAAKPADIDIFRKLLSTVKVVNSAESKLVGGEREYVRIGLDMPSCASLQNGTAQGALNDWIVLHPDNRGAVLQGEIETTISNCNALSDANLAKMAAIANLPAGGFKDTFTQIQKTSEDLEKARSASVDARNLYRTAAATLEAASTAMRNDPGKSQEQVSRALERMQFAIAQITRANDAFSTKFVAEARIASLNQVIDAVAKARETGQMPAEAPDIAKYLTQFPDMLDKARSALSDAKKPRLAPFLLMRDLEKVKSEAAARDVQVQEAIARLTDEKLRWELSRLTALVDAHDYLAGCAQCLPWRLADALQPLNEQQAMASGGMQVLKDKANVLRATTLYLDATSRLAGNANKLDYQINALHHERALATAEGNIAQWNTLISTVIGQMDDFGNSGVKKENIATLIGAVALVLAGKGVN